MTASHVYLAQEHTLGGRQAGQAGLPLPGSSESNDDEDEGIDDHENEFPRVARESGTLEGWGRGPPGLVGTGGIYTWRGEEKKNFRARQGPKASRGGYLRVVAYTDSM